MSYVDSNLLEGERVLYRTRLHWKVFVPPVLFALIVSIPLAWIALVGTWSVFAWIPVALALLWLAAALVKRQTSEFVVTNKRVLMKVGVFSVRSIELLLSKVEAIAVHQSLTGRMLGYGDIVLTGSGGTQEPFSTIQSPLAFRNAVQAASDARLGPADQA
ncbi:MAG TPA: PH domain-containing protein [Casimicrobiaceae bacterium]|nr:PH domain-containing protein [Casimicrobiaceae bacterium]